MFKPQKAKTLSKDKIKSFAGDWLVSTKYDGHQVFLVKIKGVVACYTSGWKQFTHSIFKKELEAIYDDNFILVGEFLYDCDGKLGSREKSAILTTFRTNYNKHIENNIEDEDKSYVMVFDRLDLDNNLNILNKVALNRLLNIASLPHIKPVNFSICGFDKAKLIADNLVSQGYEGAMCLASDSYYEKGKRVHHHIKIKPRLTADLLCIGTEEGEGRLSGCLGALVLKDRTNRVVRVGSGLNDAQRALDSSYYIGKVIEIEYEKIKDTYIQPIFKYVRDDKLTTEID